MVVILMVATLGCAHVQGDYHIVNGDGTFMDDGLAFIHDTIGLNMCELWLGPNYATYYPDVWGGVPANLHALAGFTPLSTALASADFHTYFLKCFSFNDAGGDLWKFPTTDRVSYYAAEYAEMYDLATHLLSTYAGTGKRFILSTSESDWPLLDGVAGTPVDPQRIQWIGGWMRTRQNAIEQARRDTPANDVYVEGCVELNRVYECFTNPDELRIVSKVLDTIKPDRVSFSAYQLITDPDGPPWWYANQAALIAATQQNLPRAFALIRDHTDAPILIGEAGFPETEVPAGYDVKTLIENMIDIYDAEDISHVLYWQVWDNTGGRGYWLQDDTGAQTDSGDQIQAMQVGRP